MNQVKRKIFAVCAALAAVMIAEPGSAGAQSFGAPQRVDTTLSIGNGGTLSVSVHGGRVSVTGTAGSSVRVRGTVQHGELDVRTRSGGVTVGTDPEGPESGRAELDISVPFGTSVEIEGHSAPLSVRGVKGAVNAENLSGDIEVSDAAGSVNIETVSGDVSISQVDGDVRAESVQGAIKVSDMKGDVAIESVSGALSMSRVTSRSVTAETVAGSVGFSGTFDPSGTYAFTSHSGAITLGLPANAGATVSLETFSGNVDSDFPVTLESGRTRSGHESRFEFRIGDGRSRVTLETFSGNIRIHRSTNRDNEE